MRFVDFVFKLISGMVGRPVCVCRNLVENNWIFPVRVFTINAKLDGERLLQRFLRILVYCVSKGGIIMGWLMDLFHIICSMASSFLPSSYSWKSYTAHGLFLP